MGFESVVIFPRLKLGGPAPTGARSAQHSTPPPSGRSKIFPQFIRPSGLSRRGAICLQTTVNYVVFYRIDDTVLTWRGCTFSGIRSQKLGYMQAATVMVRFQVHESCWVLGNLGTFKACSALLCIEFLLFGDRTKGEKKKRKGKKKTGKFALW
jgi:hypothetical protein